VEDNCLNQRSRPGNVFIDRFLVLARWADSADGRRRALYVAEVHRAALAVHGAELKGEPLALDGRNLRVLIDPAPFEDQVFAATVRFDQSAVLSPVERLNGSAVLNAGFHSCGTVSIGACSVFVGKKCAHACDHEKAKPSAAPTTAAVRTSGVTRRQFNLNVRSIFGYPLQQPDYFKSLMRADRTMWIAPAGEPRCFAERKLRPHASSRKTDGVAGRGRASARPRKASRRPSNRAQVQRCSSCGHLHFPSTPRPGERPRDAQSRVVRKTKASPFHSVVVLTPAARTKVAQLPGIGPNAVTRSSEGQRPRRSIRSSED